MKVKKFETQVQYLKYKVLREVARYAFEDRLMDCYTEIPETIVKGPQATMRCCIYKERAIVMDRIRVATGGNKSNPNIIEVMETACDGCSMGGYEVTNDCRGCIAHRCEDACKVGAISFDSDQKACIDKEKCVKCGKCANVCPYDAIHNYKRPCEKACKVGAVGMNQNKSAAIDYDKCIACGACVYQCPFGAIMDKSFLLEVIALLKESKNNTAYKTYAVVAPSISGQFTYAKLGQVIAGIKKLGFHSVVEAALGADIVSYAEGRELSEKGFLTSSCCPAFVRYVRNQFPSLAEKISHNPSPMVAIAKYIKETDVNSKVVFIGPCTAKKMEAQYEDVKPYIDNVLTYEELQALLDSRDIELGELTEECLDNASYYGRIFARSGGLSDAVAQSLKEQKIKFELKAIPCNGIEECRVALLRASKNVLPFNFIEGMACVGGCIGGAGNLTHEEKDKKLVDAYGHEAHEKTITDAISMLK